MHVEITGLVERSVDRAGAFDDIPEERTDQKEPLKRMNRRLANIYDNYDRSRFGRSGPAQHSRVAAGALVVFFVVDRVQLKDIHETIFRTVLLLINGLYLPPPTQHKPQPHHMITDNPDAAGDFAGGISSVTKRCRTLICQLFTVASGSSTNSFSSSHR